jgi:hypothetical protein
VPVAEVVGGVSPTFGNTSPRSVRELFCAACFLRYRRRVSMTPARLDQDYAPYVRMRS